MNTQIFLRCSLGLALSISLLGQVKPPPPSTGGGAGSTGGITAPPRGIGTNTPPPNMTPGVSPDTIERPAYISGKVVMEDGTKPPEPVPIQLVCRANPHTVGFTDPKGTFGIDLNNRLNRSMFVDASENSGGFGPNGSRGGGSNSGGLVQNNGGGVFSSQFMGCDIQASLPGFRSDVIHLDARRTLDNPEIGTIILHRLANVEGLTISATSQLAPKDAKKAFEKGRNDVQKKKLDEAQKEFEKAVEIYPKYAVAWFELGMVQEDKKDVEGARKSFAAALAADGKYVNPYLELAAMAMVEQKWQEAADQSDHLLRLNPVDFPRAWMINALANFYGKHLDVAEKSAAEGISRDTGHHYPVLHRVLAVIQAQRQDYVASAQNLRDYLKYAPNATDSADVKKQLADVEKITGPEAKKQ
jgi:tetratricopeptide (TPR) repeat protein